MQRAPPCHRTRSPSPTLGQEQLSLGPQIRILPKVPLGKEPHHLAHAALPAVQLFSSR